MAGKVNRVAALFLKETPKALYTHSANHRLKFAICSSCDIVNARNRMSTVKDVTYLFKFSPIRADHLEKFILPKEEAKKVKTKLPRGWQKLMVWTYLEMSLFQLFQSQK